MTTTGLRELRQNASELVRQAEAGETIIVTVSGRAVAELGPVRRNRWRAAADVVDIFRGTVEAQWTPAERDHIDQGPVDPFSR